MAEIQNNPLLKGAKGMFGKTMVYKNRNGKLIMANRPKSPTNTPTALQDGVRMRFLEAVYYGKGLKNNPELKAIYEAGVSGNLTSAYGVAVADYLSGPTINLVDTTRYQGVVGNTITIRAIDDFCVTSVQVIVSNAQGAIIEQGDAVINPAHGLEWVYTITQVNAQVIGTTVRVVARDRPGNVAEQVVQL
jgi:hypothetical protein